MQVKKQQLEWDMEQWTGSKVEKEYIKAVYCHSPCLFNLHAEYIMLGWMIRFIQALAFTAKGVRKCSITKPKSICEANLRWILACYWNGVNSNNSSAYLLYSEPSILSEYLSDRIRRLFQLGVNCYIVRNTP